MIGNIRNGVCRWKVEQSFCPKKAALVREGEGKIQMVRPFPAFLQAFFLQMQSSADRKIRVHTDCSIRQRLTLVRDFEGGDHGNILMGRSIILDIESISIPFRHDIEILGVGRHARRKIEPDIRNDSDERQILPKIISKFTPLVQSDFEQALVDIGYSVSRQRPGDLDRKRDIHRRGLSDGRDIDPHSLLRSSLHRETQGVVVPHPKAPRLAFLSQLNLQIPLFIRNNPIGHIIVVAPPEDLFRVQRLMELPQGYGRNRGRHLLFLAG